MMPVSVRVGPIAAFATFSGESRILSTKPAGEIPTKGVWVSRQYNATHIISIPGNWLIGGDLAVLMTAERHFLLEVQSSRARFLACEMWIDKAAIPLDRNRDSISLL
jgi:hypothetical protein